MKKLLSLVILAAFAFMFPTETMAQNGKERENLDAVTEVVELFKTPDINYTETSKKLQKIEDTLKGGRATIQKMSEDVKFLEETRNNLLSARKDIDQELKFVQKRIDALGQEPEDGSKELDIIAQKRTEFKKEEAFQKGKIAEADILTAKIEELNALILDLRNRELLGSLITKQSPLYYPNILFGASKQFVEFVFDIIRSPVLWYQDLNAEQKIYVKSNLIPVGVIVALSLWLGIWLRLFIMRRFGYKKEIEHPRYGMKVFAAIFVAIAYGVIPASIIIGLMIWIVSTKVMTVGFFGLVLIRFLYISLYVIMATALSRVTFAPYNEKWRLVAVNNEKAKRITSALYFSAYAIGLATLLEQVAVTANYGLELNYFVTVVSSAVKAFCIVLVVKRVLWDEISEDEEGVDDEGVEIEEEEGFSSAFKITFFVSVFAIGVVLLAVAGYPKLSAFILNRSMWSAVVIGFFIVMRKALSEVMHRLLLMRFWVKTFKMRRRMLSKIDFWMNLIIDPILVLTMIFVLLSLWGVSTDLLMQSVKKLFFGFQVGGVNISLIAIIFAILAFFVSLAVVKALRNRLVNNVLAKMDIDDGIKHSLSSGFSFVGFILAAIIAITVMGGNLGNLALIASALSVGIGFGLQNVINNFVSGIIILFERPFKVGDWVIVNNEEGRIKQINIRSTEIETFKKTSIIIPNATLISNSVTNLTHGNNWSRQSVRVGVAYGTDVDKVKQILLDCAARSKYVMKNPAPYVLFQDFGNSSLDFELRCYTNDIWNGWIIPSELRFEINKRFFEEGIEIPFPQMVVHKGDEVAPEEQFYAKKKLKKAK